MTVNFNVSNYLPQKHNWIWMNSRRGDVVCKYRRTKIAQGENNHVCSNKSIYQLFRFRWQYALSMATPFEPIPVNQIASISTVGYTSSIYLLVSFLCALGITFSVGIDLIVIAIKTTLSMSFKG